MIRNKFMGRQMILALVMFFGLATIFPSVSLANEQQVNEEDVEELANVLKVVYEEAVIKDEYGNTVGIDVEKLREEFGDIEEFAGLEDEIIASCQTKDSNIIQPMHHTEYHDNMNKCVNEGIVDNFGPLVTGAALAGIVDAILDKQYTTAAKKIISAGFRGSVVGTGVTLATMFIGCMIEHG
ncbi:hypothetical protein [Bacillus mesophilum]|uniref:Uncharacterized protein n=1 Tax=Bacillus mesophilum TaxID=1071718 RepID=A0A7V7RPC2_9BACI|nr:hypothetical protein [Bacillus mesophilum]KAB2335099.1 hypothetical protein F7732_00555 [Bacillus mesophilum]